VITYSILPEGPSGHVSICVHAWVYMFLVCACVRLHACVRASHRVHELAAHVHVWAGALDAQEGRACALGNVWSPAPCGCGCGSAVTTPDKNALANTPCRWPVCCLCPVKESVLPVSNLWLSPCGTCVLGWPCASNHSPQAPNDETSLPR